MLKKYDYLVSIDPAGIGKSGLIVIDLSNWKIVFQSTYESETVSDSICEFKSIFDLIKINFKENIFVYVEDFYLSEKVKITNPLATAKVIGSLEALTKYHYKWTFETYLPSEKRKFKNQIYKGNIKLTSHEADAWIGARIFKEKYYDY